MPGRTTIHMGWSRTRNFRLQQRVEGSDFSYDELVIIPGRSVGASRHPNDFSSIVNIVVSRIHRTGIIIIPV